MARKVFFSFHYDDVTRANVVRNSDVIARRYQAGARFYDKSLWEEAKKQGSLAIKRMINGGLEGSSVTCVLIGQETWQRPWVRYEILKSMARGNGILGVDIHDVGFDPAVGRTTLLSGLFAPTPAPVGGLLGHGLFPPQMQIGSLGLFPSAATGSDTGLTPAPSPGRNPFPFLGYTIDRSRASVAFHEVGPNDKWQKSEHVDSVPLSDLGYLSNRKSAGSLADLFSVYGWKQHDGSANFHTWVEAAAGQVANVWDRLLE